MKTVIFRCPRTRSRVQGWTAAEESVDENTYVGVECLACGQMHLINLKTGKALGEDK